MHAGRRRPIGAIVQRPHLAQLLLLLDSECDDLTFQGATENGYESFYEKPRLDAASENGQPGLDRFWTVGWQDGLRLGETRWRSVATLVVVSARGFVRDQRRG
jgi:hypothetical protein